MAFRTIQIDLQFNANVSKAKQQMSELQSQLNSLATSQPNTQLSLTPQLQQAQQAALQLKTALNNAMNTDTGRLNLNKFQAQLNQSGMSLKQLAAQMQTLGPAGVQAFSNMSSMIAQADTRMFSLTGKAKSFVTSIAHSTQYQLASTLIYGTINSFKETLDYAEKLDTSLNNIRIVTGKGADEMARFAKEANAMAKELSTSTTKYTDASLIYYQQGLGDKEVKERTDVTVKLANIVGEEVSTVSDWMTAIWNNFDDGAKSVEYYADILTKLGAATASSADEIADGLEKFAAVAETVGLSYEYATSALATITAETRQSADVVGTALKTLFARMEGLKLGETLEDGTTLNQYSLSLEKVGVSIKDANGELKNMDTILDETGARWDTLAKDEQVALAQSVAGIRQYTQFMALMDNWDVMENNLKLTEEASGALEEQQRIYEESSAAAKERMTAAAEEFKTLIVGGEDLTKVYDFAGGALEIISDVFKSMGGLKTLFLGVAAALLKMYQPQVATMFANMGVAAKDAWAHVQNFASGKGWVGNGQAFQIEAASLASKLVSSTSNNTNTGVDFTKENFEMEQARVNMANKMSESERQIVDWKIQLIKLQQEEIINNDKILQQKQKDIDKNAHNLEEQLNSNMALSSVTKTAEKVGKAEAHGEYGLASLEQAAALGKLDQQSRTDLGASLTDDLSIMKQQLQEVDVNIDKLSFGEVENSLKQYIQSGEGLDILIEKMKQLNKEMSKAGTKKINQAVGDTKLRSADSNYNTLSELSGTTADTSIKTTTKKLNSIDLRSGKMSKQDKQTIKQMREEGKLLKDKNKWMQKTGKSEKDYTKAVKDFNKHVGKKSKELTKENKNYKKNIKSSKEYRKITKGTTKDINKQGQDIRKQSKDMELNTKSKNNNTKAQKELTEQIKAGQVAITSTADKIAKGVSDFATLAMGISMVTSAAEQMGKMFASGDKSFSGWISNISSMAMGLAMVIPVMAKMSSALFKHTLLLGQNAAATWGVVKAKIAEKMATLAEIVASKASLLSKAKDIAVTIGQGFAHIFKAVAQNPVKGAAYLAAALPFLLLAGGAVTSMVSGAEQAEEEKTQEDIDKGKENLEAIDENQELATSVSDLTEEYKNLRNTGQSTAEVLEQMREKIPELIDSYKELGNTIGMPIDTTALERAYEVFEKTGDISLFEEEQKIIDDQVKAQEKSTATTVADKSADLVMDAAFEGQGHKNGSSYTYHMGDVGLSSDKENQVQDIFSDELGDLWEKDSDGAGGQFTIEDYENEGQLIDAYNKMLAARNRLKEQNLDDTDYYTELNEEIQQMVESMPDLIESQQKLFEIQKEEALEDQSAFNDEVFGDLDDKITDVKSYTAARQDLIDKLVEEKQWTEAQAESYLAASNAFGAFEDAYQQFGEDADESMFNAEASVEEIQKIKEWFAKLPEEDRTLAMNIDYTVVGSLDDAKAALEEQREKMRIANAKKEVTDLGVEESAFDMHSQILQNTNKHLAENEARAAEVAAANFKLNKGLKTLQDSWDDNLEILSEANRMTPEYAEALGEVHDALEQAFGVSVSAEFLETEENLELIGRLARGDVDALDELQDKMAEDYVANMHIDEFAINDAGVAVAVEEGRQALQEMLDSIDTSMELGEGTHLSGDYLNTVQQMLDTGQITHDQLQEMMRAKGYELEVTGWKEVEGPKKTIKQTTTNWLGVTTTKTITEQEMIQVPIINGEGEAVSGTAAPASIVRTTTEDSVNFSQTNESGEVGEKAYDKKRRLKDLDNEIERYHEIDEIIQDIERDLSSLSTAKDRAFGAKKINLINEEIAAQKKLLKAEKERQKEAENWYKKDRQYILDNYAVKLDKEGNITNYNDLIRQEANKLKGMDPDSEAYKEQESYLSDMKEDFAQYEETLDEVNEAQESVIEQQNALQDLAMEKIEYKIQMKVDMADDDRKYFEFLMSKYEDDDFAAVEKINSYSGTTKADMSAWNANQKGIDKVQKDLATGKISEEDAIAKLRELRDEQIELVQSMEETRNSVFESLQAMFDAWNEKFDTQIEKIQHAKTVAQGYKNIIDLVGKDNLGIDDATMKRMNDFQVSSSRASLATARAKKEANEAHLADLQAKRATAEAAGQDTSKWDEQIEYAEEQVRSSTEEFMDSWNEALEAAAEAFAAEVESIAETFSESVSGIYKNLDELEQAFERQKTLNELYLKDYEKTYEISKLNRSIQDSIDKTDNVGSQKELRNLQKELLEMSKEGAKVSKYDIEYMQKKYDLMVAEQALKDAQNAKSVVRLQRDSEGNYGYVYTADQDNVDKAQQTYEDKLYAMEKFGDDLLMEAQNQYIALNQAWKEAMMEIAQDQTLSDEEKKAKMAEVTEYYKGQMQFWMDTSNDILLRGTEINAQYGASMATSFNQTIMGSMFPDINSFEQLFGQSMTNMDGSMSKFTIAIDGYGNTIEGIFSDAGDSVEGFKNNVNTYLDEAESDVDEMKGASNSLRDDMIDDMSEASGAVEGFESTYANKMESVRSETQDTIDKIDALITKLNEYNNTPKPDSNDVDNSGDGKDGSGPDEGGNNPKQDPKNGDETVVEQDDGNKNKDPYPNSKYKKGQTFTMTSSKINISTKPGEGSTTDMPKHTWSGGKILDVAYADSSYWYKFKRKTNGADYVFWVRGAVLRDEGKVTGKASYDTGGYTGEWGPEGRIAMLHQKEIVLNAHDTENFLAAIGIVRDINDQIEKNAIAMQYTGQLNNYSAKLNAQAGTLQQDITIHAEFPNATNHSEIEEAFRNLGNLASQYANRKS